MPKPRVSVLMPCYNAEMYLPYALAGLEDLEYDNFEVIIIDDGSSDNSAELIAQVRGLTIKYIRNETNLGVAASLNKGLQSVDGEFIARFDADDFIYPYQLKDQVYSLLADPDLAVVGSGADVFGDIYTVYRSPTTHAAIMDQFLLNNPMIHPTIMFKRNVLDNGDLYYRTDITTDEDYELWARLITKYKFRNLEFSTIKYRIHGSNNQRIPGRREAKTIIIQEFLSSFGVSNDQLVEALVEFQCSGYISCENYQILRDYAVHSSLTGLPKLGWFHEWLLFEKHYHLFMDYQPR